MQVVVVVAITQQAQRPVKAARVVVATVAITSRIPQRVRQTQAVAAVVKAITEVLEPKAALEL
jgi:hypothetical protein